MLFNKGLWLQWWLWQWLWGENGISFCPRGRFFQGWLVCGPERLWLVVCLVSWTGTAFIIKVCSLM